MDNVQQQILDRVERGQSVFFTGSAGTGKTYTLNQIVNRLKVKYGREFSKKVAVAAMTGLAASHINGVTLYAALGIGIAKRVGDVGNGMHRKAKDVNQLDVLIVDECSMLSAELLHIIVSDPLITRRKTPLQLIFCGDFYQLQPVPNKVPRDASLDAIRNFGWAFETSDWSDIFKPENSFVLEKVYRQDDEAFVQTLNRIRTGDAVDGRRALRELVDECSRPLACPDGIRPTMVYTTNDVIDQVNQGELAKLSSPLRTFSAKDTNAVSPDVATAQASLAAAALARDPFYKNCPATQSLALKVGAQVMLTRNIDVARGLCNGSRGVVVDFEPGPGGGGNTAAAMLPVVKFISGQVATIEMMTYEHEVAGLGTCRRLQLPLKLAWAISTHKSQGMTLDLAVVSLDNVFAYGQAYVALSRARSKAGMQIVGWDGKFKAADASVARFYEGVRSGAPAEPSERWLAYADARGWLMPKDTCLIVPSSDEEGEG